MPAPESVGFIWDQAEVRLEAQLRQADALDTKAGILVGLHAVAVGILASALSGLGRPTAGVATAMIAALATSGSLALLAFRSQDYDRRPRPEELWRFGTWSGEELRYRFLSTRFRAIEANRVKLRRKARFVTASLFILMVLGLSLGAVAGLDLWT